MAGHRLLLSAIESCHSVIEHDHITSTRTHSAFHFVLFGLLARNSAWLQLRRAAREILSAGESDEQGEIAQSSAMFARQPSLKDL